MEAEARGEAIMQPLGFTTTRKTTHTTLKLLRLQSKAITTTTTI